MQAILLVGGFGTRLHPLTLSTPKQLLPIIGRPMIEHVVDALARHGVERVVLALGYRGDAFRDAYPDARHGNVELFWAEEPEPLDTAGAIRFAYEAADMDASHGTFLVANGDVITDLDIAAMLAAHRRARADATIHLVPVADPSRYGVVVTEAGGRVLEFLEKPDTSAGAAPSRWINAGTYLMERSVIDRIEPGRPVSVEREVFPALAADGALRAHREDSYWVDAGTPETYLRVQFDLLDGVRRPPLPGVSQPVGSEGAVSPDAAVHVRASVERSALLAGSLVNSGASVQRSVVSECVEVGARAVVRNCCVHRDAVIGDDAVVLDSIVGERAVIGSGARVTEGTIVGAHHQVCDGAVLSAARAPETP